MNLSLRTLLGLSISLSLAACTFGNYRVVKKVPNGGEVALEGMRDEARQKAEGYMKEQCSSGYDVLEEGEAVVGQESSAQSRPGTTLLGTKSTNTNVSTTDKREWRIKYQCKGTATAPATEKAATPAAAPAPGAAPAPAPGAPHGKIHEIIVRF
jgi:hypothetical protein